MIIILWTRSRGPCIRGGGPSAINPAAASRRDHLHSVQRRQNSPAQHWPRQKWVRAACCGLPSLASTPSDKDGRHQRQGQRLRSRGQPEKLTTNAPNFETTTAPVQTGRGQRQQAVGLGGHTAPIAPRSRPSSSALPPQHRRVLPRQPPKHRSSSRRGSPRPSQRLQKRLLPKRLAPSTCELYKNARERGIRSVVGKGVGRAKGIIEARGRHRHQSNAALADRERGAPHSHSIPPPSARRRGAAYRPRSSPTAP